MNKFKTSISDKSKMKFVRAGEGDRVLLVLIGVIVLIGLVMLFSASPAIAYLRHKDSYYFITRQILWLVLGVIAFLFFAKIDYRFWKERATLLLFMSVVLLVIVFIPGIGSEWGSARSWIFVFGQSFQPSEFVKLTFLLYLAAWLESREGHFENIEKSIVPFLFVLGVISGLMILQPDLGTLSIIGFSSLVVYYVAGGKKRHLFVIILAGLFGLMIMLPYQKDRIMCLKDPASDPKDKCYQVNQSLIAVGSGGIFGRGLGASRQKFSYLPEVVNDSIFAVICEETGFIFAGFFISLFGFLLYRGAKIAELAQDTFGKLSALGITAWITTQALVNISGTINLIPLTGIPLPLVSYGGTSMIATLGALGLLYNISKHAKKAHNA
jgi:cell division protein FtsW